MSALGQLVVSLVLDHAKFTDGLGKGEYAVKKSVSSMQREFGALKSSIAALGGLIGIGGLTAFVKTSIDAADAISKLSQKTGIAVENLTGWQHVMDLSGATTEQFEMAIGKLNTVIVKTPEKLRAIGVSGTDAHTVMLQLADAFTRIENPTTRAALAAEIFGERVGRNMVVALGQGRQSIEELIRTGQALNPITTQMARDAEKFNDALDTLRKRVSTVGISLANEMLPSLNKTLVQMEEGIRIAGSFGAALKFGLSINPLQSPGENLKEIQAEIKTLESMRDDLRAGGKLSVKHKDGRVFFGYDIGEIDKEISELKKRAEFVKVLRAQALGLPTKGEMAREAARQRAEVNALLRGPIDAADIFKDKSPGKSDKYKSIYDDDGTLLYKTQSESVLRFINAQQRDYEALQKEIGQAAVRMVEEARQWAEEEDAHLRKTLDEIGNPRAAWNLLENRLSRAQARLDAAAGIISSAEASNQSQVVAGLKSQAQAQIDLRDAIGAQGEAIADLLPDLQAMMTLYGPEQRAQIQAMVAKIREWQAVGRQKGWLAGAQAGLREYGLAAEDTFATVKDATVRAMQGMEDAMLNFTKTGKLEFKSMANSIIDDMLRMAIRAGITRPLSQAFGNFLGGFFGGTQAAAPIVEAVPSAAGNLFSAGTGLAPWRNRVVTRPTLFAFARGVGLMGEEPGSPGEAIMPLQRMRGGDLGVRVSGLEGGVTLHQHITIDARGADAGVDERIRRAMAIAKDAAVAEVNNSLYRGGRTARLAGIA